jgi:hypothetical protein
MDVSLPLTQAAAPTRADAALSTVEIPQYRRRAIFAVWAAAALPMAALAWLVAPALADRLRPLGAATGSRTASCSPPTTCTCRGPSR